MISTETALARRLAPERSAWPELVAYSVSPAYFAVRQHLGVAIG